MKYKKQRKKKKNKNSTKSKKIHYASGSCSCVGNGCVFDGDCSVTRRINCKALLFALTNMMSWPLL